MRKPSPRILYVSSGWPLDRAFGGQLRALNIGRALQQVGDVTVVVVSSDVAEEEVVRRTAAEFRVDPPVHVNTHPNRGLTQRLRWAFDPRFLNVHGCVADREDRARLLQRMNEFDLVWILNSRTPNILQQWRWPRSVLDIDDVPSTFQRTVWQQGAGRKERLRAGAQMIISRRRERLWKERFTVLSVCSEADRQYLGGGEHIHVIPNGFDRPEREPCRNRVDPPRIGFIGLYSFPPNLEGVRWFMRACWPRIKREIPDLRLRLVGKDSDGPLRPLASDVDALGWVADPAAEIATWSAMIVPLRYGAGTRVKIADAFSRKCPVVSTRLGAYGYDVQPGRELLLADSTQEFASACISLIRDPATAASMAERAFQAFIGKWTWDLIAPKVWAAAEDGLRRSGHL
jgi:glycosyltransferase involved in cell wall biosynthesis